MKIRPTNKYVVIGPTKIASNAEVDGILLPDGANLDTSTGTVLDVGPDVENVTEGDIVILPKEEAVELNIGDDHIIVIHEDLLLAIIEE